MRRRAARTSAAAVTRSWRDRPEPSTIRTPASGTPRAASSRRMTMQPALVVPAPRIAAPRCLTSISAKKLSLILFMRRTIAVMTRERTTASVVEPAGALPRAALPPTEIPARDESLPEGLGGPECRIVDRPPVAPWPGRRRGPRAEATRSCSTRGASRPPCAACRSTSRRPRFGLSRAECRRRAASLRVFAGRPP